MTSPMALKRTTSRRLIWAARGDASSEAISGSRTQPRPDDVSGGMVFAIADDRNPPAVCAYFVGFGHCVGGVISAFRMNVRPNLANNGAHVGFGKDYDGIHVGERRQDFGPFFGRHDGPSLPL